MARKCTKCLEVKDKSMFPLASSKQGYLRGDCLDCRRLMANRKAYNKNLKSKQKLSEYGCCVCGIKRHEVLEVHHLHRDYKRYGRSQSAVANLQDLEKETAVVLCANDHSLFHSHFGGKNADFPPQTKDSVIAICLLERAKGGI